MFDTVIENCFVRFSVLVYLGCPSRLKWRLQVVLLGQVIINKTI